MSTYRTFTRSCTSFEEFASAKKRTVDTGLTREEAIRACSEFNKNRTPEQIRKGTKMEWDEE